MNPRGLLFSYGRKVGEVGFMDNWTCESWVWSCRHLDKIIYININERFGGKEVFHRILYVATLAVAVGTWGWDSSH